MITELRDSEYFVFGSNLAGIHAGGAAQLAARKFEAVHGIGEGLTGRCYALPTLDQNFEKRSDEDLTRSIRTFLDAATLNPDKRFLLTKIGCGIAGYEEVYIRAKFEDVPPNVILPEDWR